MSWLDDIENELMLGKPHDVKPGDLWVDENGSVYIQNSNFAVPLTPPRETFETPTRKVFEIELLSKYKITEELREMLEKYYPERLF